MNYYENELKALKRAGLLRQRNLFNDNLIDIASNDYLGFANDFTLVKDAFEKISHYKNYASKASMIVNGYHYIHKEFEEALCAANGFESAIIVGSGFAANIAIIEALVRKSDTIFIDELYHASGLLASKLVRGKVIFFRHNDENHLKKLLKISRAKRNIIAVEGIYSMHGDKVNKEIFHLANKYDALLILDEAHSSGVIGRKLLGILDFYDLQTRDNYIKMGTLGKAFGSFGAYILASKHITQYLINRAKPIIYSTALSIFDTALALQSLKKIQLESKSLSEKIRKRQQTIKDIFSINIDSLIVPIVINDNYKVLSIQKSLQDIGFIVGAIRQPTVSKAIIRVIARVNIPISDLKTACLSIKKFQTSY